MDWLLIDSEPLWHIWEIKVFKKYWIEIDPTQTMWLKINEIVEYWYNKMPWDLWAITKEKLWEDLLQTMSQLFLTDLIEKSWVKYIMKFFKKKWLKIAINSASHYILIDSAIEKMGIWEYIEVIHSGQDEEFWKPHPGWYITTCKKMWLLPSEVIAFEDSLNWVISVKSAKIRCICIPDKNDYSNSKFAIADIKLNSLDDFNEDTLSKLN